jgi:thioredoxin reductase (NADPH)
MNRVDVTIIGGGPTGLFASFYAGLRGMEARIIDSLPQLGGQLMALYPEKYIYDMPGYPAILAKDLAANMIEQGLQFEPEVVLGETVVDLQKDPEGYTLTTDKNKTYLTRTVIIAAGAGAFTPTRLGVEGEETYINKGLYYGVQQKSLFENKSIAIVGGGDSAFDWALELEPLAKEIRLIHRRDQFRAYENTVRKVQASRVEMKLWSVVEQFIGNSTLKGVVIQNLQTKEREELYLDALIVNVGFKSSLGPLKTWGLNIQKNQIMVDRHFQTNLSGVFAVGDVAGFEEKIKLIATGFGEATTAVCYIKTLLDPKAKLFPGHSTDMDLEAIKAAHVLHSYVSH